MEQKTPNKNQPNGNVCNCNNKFRTSLCPVHDTVKENAYNESIMILTDAHISPEKLETWMGHAFVCQNCTGHILHDMNYCPGCGKRVMVQSSIVTTYINELSAKMKAK